jgi:hypothetical protein
MSHLDERTHYTIRVEGAVDGSLADWCGPLTLQPGCLPDGKAITTLDDIYVDQAGLVGMIRYLHGVGLVLLFVERCQ